MNKQPILEDRQKRIASGFDSAADHYDQHATLEREVADRLLASLKPWKDSIPKGPIAELGCGTGFITEGLAEFYPNREIQAIDISEAMVNHSRQRFQGNKNISVKRGDAKFPPHKEPHYAVTVAGFMAHWLKDPATTLAKWLEITKPGGFLLASFPGNESFPRWRKHCRELGLPFTANPLPDVEEMVVKMSLGPAQVDFYEDTITRTFEHPRQFFESLKKTGSDTQLSGRSLTQKELALLIDHWDKNKMGKVEIDYHIVFLAVKRDYNS